MVDSTSFNNFTYLPDVPHKIVSRLMSNELIWKLLNYNDATAWNSSHANLTKAEKSALIYDGIKTITACRVFLDFGQDDAWTEESTMLRVSVVEVIPSNYVWGNLTILFEIYPHYKVNQLSNYQPRGLVIAQQIIQELNGTDIGTGVGRLYFDYSQNQKTKLGVAGAQPYKGVAVSMCNYALG